MSGAGQQLARLHAGELGKGSVRSFIAPDALRGREHRIAAIAFLIIAIILVAVDDDLIADRPAFHFGADGIDDAGRIGARDMIGILVAIDR